jgi:hypothetical protein
VHDSVVGEEKSTLLVGNPGWKREGVVVVVVTADGVEALGLSDDVFGGMDVY